MAKQLAIGCCFLVAAIGVTAKNPNWQRAYTPDLSTADYDNIKQQLTPLLDSGWGPKFVRLAWHDAGTWDKKSKTGGPMASMRFRPVSAHPANLGLAEARDVLEPIHASLGGKITYADLWSYAGAVAISHAGGPKINWRPGRNDYDQQYNAPTPGNRLPNANKDAAHLREIFSRMDFDDEAIVALSGAHCLGGTNFTNSGFLGPWTENPLQFSNMLFVNLLQLQWTQVQNPPPPRVPGVSYGPTKRRRARDIIDKQVGPTPTSDIWDVNIPEPTGSVQFNATTVAGVGNNKGGSVVMMLPTDHALSDDAKLKEYSELYAKDQDRFFEDFQRHYSALLEVGVSDLLVPGGEWVDTCLSADKCVTVPSNGDKPPKKKLVNGSDKGPVEEKKDNSASSMGPMSLLAFASILLLL